MCCVGCYGAYLLGETLDAKDRLVLCPLVGNEAITVTIDHQIQSFKHYHAQKNVLSEHHGSDLYLSPEHFYRYHLSEIDFLNASIGVLCICASQTYQP